MVVQGRAERVTERSALEAMSAAVNAKYGTDYGFDMIEPASNSVFSLRPEWVFALDTGLAREMGEPVPGVDRQPVSRWERGNHRPRPYYTSLLSRLHEASPTELTRPRRRHRPSCPPQMPHHRRR